MEDTSVSVSVHIVHRLTVRPPIYIVASRDIFTCAPYFILVWDVDRRLENKGFLVACGDRDGLVADLTAGDRGWPAVTCGDLR